MKNFLSGILVLIRSGAWYLHFALSLLIAIPKIIWLRHKRRKIPELEFTGIANKIVQNWAKSQIKWSGAKVDIRGIENIPECPVVFIGNHQSYFDIGAYLSFIDKPKGFVAKAEMKKAPVISTYMEFINCIFMDRKDIKKAAQSINEGIDKIKNGHSLVIFPEGTRSKSNSMNEWKQGSFKLATKAKAPVVPVALYDSFMVLEANNYKFKPHKVTMVFSEPVYTENLTKEQLAELPLKIKNIIQNNLDAIAKEKEV